MKMLMIFALLFSLMGPALAQTELAQRQKHYNLEKGLAIQGYDPVAYLLQNKAVKGVAANAVSHKGVTYHFATTANKDLFIKNPSKYEPAYGGWCAYAMGATGEKVEIDPKTFEVRDGKLYLFYNSYFTNTLPKWQKDEPNLHRKADQSWMKFEPSKS
jgi:YHS domain-containing protein